MKLAENIAKPLVSTPTTSSSESIRTVLQDHESGRIFIPDYQRDSDQWDEAKKSLFIESVLNNLTVPAFFLCPTSEEGKLEVVDGQQRLTTLREFYSNKLKLVPYDEAPYLSSIYYADKIFKDLPDSFKNTFESYKLTLIQLPYNLGESIRLEIFRRINEGGTPLSAQDIRLAYYGQCKPVTLIRLCGIYDKSRQGSNRMMVSAESKHGLIWPWGETQPEIQQVWKGWWLEKQKASGQTASEMFLWFIIAKYLKEINEILLNKNYLANELKTAFTGRTEEVADILCAQLLYETNHIEHRKLCSVEDIQTKLFPVFADWFFSLISHIPSVRVDKYRRLAFLIAAMANISPKDLSDLEWGLIDNFVKKPRDMALKYELSYPESKGNWGGPKGQSAQISSYFAVAENILRET